MPVERLVIGGIDGHSNTAPALMVITGGGGIPVGAAVTLANPAAWNIGVTWMPVQVDHEAKTAGRTHYRYRAGFRVHVELSWEALAEDERSDIVAKINANDDYYIRFWPHVGQPSVYYDCNITDGGSVDGYVLGAPVGYTGKLILVGRELYGKIPLFERGYHFTDTDDHGAYVASDEILYFTRSADVAADNYLAGDKIGFFWRRPGALGG